MPRDELSRRDNWITIGKCEKRRIAGNQPIRICHDQRCQNIVVIGVIRNLCSDARWINDISDESQRLHEPVQFFVAEGDPFSNRWITER